MSTTVAILATTRVIGQFAKRNWRPIAVLIVVMSAYLWVSNMRETVDELNAEITELQDRNIQLQNNAMVLQAAIKSANESLDEVSETTKQVEAETTKLAAAHARKTAELNRTIDRLRALPTPKTCNDAIDFLQCCGWWRGFY